MSSRCLCRRAGNKNVCAPTAYKPTRGSWLGAGVCDVSEAAAAAAARNKQRNGTAVPGCLGGWPAARRAPDRSWCGPCGGGGGGGGEARAGFHRRLARDRDRIARRSFICTSCVLTVTHAPWRDEKNALLLSRAVRRTRRLAAAPQRLQIFADQKLSRVLIADPRSTGPSVVDDLGPQLAPISAQRPGGRSFGASPKRRGRGDSPTAPPRVVLGNTESGGDGTRML